MRLRQVLSMAGAIGMLALSLAGCGSATSPTASTTSRASQGAAHSATTTWVIADRTSSFRRIAGQFLQQMESIVLDQVEPARGKVIATAIDGSPLTTAKLVTADFAVPPPGIEDADLIANFELAKAYGFKRKLDEMIHGPVFAKGSGILDGLLLSLSDPGDVYVFSDGIESVPGFSLYKASQADVAHEIARYASRFRGQFSGHTVTFVGVGRGAPNARVVERAHELYEALVVRIGGGQLRWLSSLDEI